MVVLVRDRHVVHGFDMFSFSEMLDCRDEALCAWVEEVFGDGAGVGFAPFACGFCLLGGVSCCFAEADEPCLSIQLV